MSEKDWTIGNIIALAEHFGKCIHRNFNAAYYHGEIDVREREKKEANKNEIEARIELEQAISGILDERDQLRSENERLRDALQSLFNKCLLADERGELSELISGELLDSVGTLLGYTPENEIKKEREFLEAIKQALNEVTK